VQWQIGTLAQGKGVVIYIDSVAGVNSTWSRSNVSVAGAYTFDTGALVRSIPTATDLTVFSGVAEGAYMRFRSSGDDVILSHSPDNTTYTDYHTYTNALVGRPDSLYIKCYQALAGDGTRFADITLNPTAGSTSPAKEILNYENFTFVRSEGSPESVVDGIFGDQYTDK
jgi:hypothetical protein